METERTWTVNPVIACLVLAVCSCFASTSRASIFEGEAQFSEQGLLSARAEFSIVSGKLQIILTNTASADVTKTSQGLAGFFFNTNTTATLTADKVFLSNGSVVFYADTANGPGAGSDGTLNNTGDVSSEFGFQADVGKTILGIEFGYGIGSSGLDIFGPSDRFDTNNDHDLDSPIEPDGSNYLITSAGDISSTGNGGLTGDPIIKNSVVITLNIDGVLDLNSITDVVFQYGTGLDEPSFVEGSVVPEPSSYLVFAGLALCFGIAIANRSRRKKRALQV